MAQGNVVVWSGEDAIDDTLLPRFIAAGGDRNHIAFIAGVEEDGNEPRLRSCAATWRLSPMSATSLAT